MSEGPVMRGWPPGGAAGDFLAVLKAHGYELTPRFAALGAQAPPVTEATTVLALKFRDGVLVAGDRRATAGHMVMYERAEKLINVDRHSILAVAGVPAVAFEMARVLEHSLQYYRRSQLQEMSTAGKVRSLSKLLKENLPLTLQGVGTVVPIFATYDEEGGKVFFYDALGAQFESGDFAASGSGALAVRSVLHYVNQWGNKPLARHAEDEATVVALRALDTAAASDTATGGHNPRANVFPTVRVITREGIHEVSDTELAKLYRSEV